MEPYRMRFIVGKLSEEELLTLKNGGTVISKMLLIPEDFQAFHYKEGDAIEAETQEGNRVWTSIRGMEIVEDRERVIVILTLTRQPADRKN